MYTNSYLIEGLYAFNYVQHRRFEYCGRFIRVSFFGLNTLVDLFLFFKNLFLVTARIFDYKIDFVTL